MDVWPEQAIPPQATTLSVLFITAEPSPLEFTPITTGSQTVTVTNVSRNPVTLGNPVVTGGQAADFVIDSGCRGVSLAPDATCKIGVTFRARGQGVRSAELDINLAGGTKGATVQMTGPGLIP